MGYTRTWQQFMLYLTALLIGFVLATLGLACAEFLGPG